MAVQTAGPKQTLPTHPLLEAIGNTLHFLPHHEKPFRRRHVLFLVLSFLLVVFTLVELATVITKQSLNPRTLFSAAVTPGTVEPRSVVKSSNGFDFVFPSQKFTATARSSNINGPVSDNELKKGDALTNVILTPLPSRVPGPEAAAQFEINIEDDGANFATYKSAVTTKLDITAITADYFAPKETNLAVVTEENRTTESINGTLMTKATYVVSPKFAGNPTRTIVYSAQIKDKPTSITIRGIVAGGAVPSSMLLIMQSMQLDSDTKVEGISTFFGNTTPPVVDQKYAADLVSPAVVKIYHIVCGSLVFRGQVMSDDTCSGNTGSGFLVSSDGYIATNGHVVVYGAKDMLVSQLLSDRDLLRQFITGTKLSKNQIEEVMQRPDLIASIVSGIYDLSDSELRLINQRELTITALGNNPLNLDSEDDLRGVVGKFEGTKDLKQASVVGYDYAPKDQLTLLANPEKGFSASDVALLKISIENAPIVVLGKNPVTQNQKITVFGFPGDADNPLTDNTSLGVSVTNGSISSIRDAAGGKSKLYQSDVDASQGNSGGPAIDENGEAFGLLTYRFASGEAGNAAKSYIRDIADFNTLVDDKKVTLNTASTTQEAWQKGLDAYSKHYYSESLRLFEQVSREYPSHRLASTYIDLSKQAIKDGKEVRDPSILILILATGAGLGGLAVAVVMIAKHHGFNKLYRLLHEHGLLPQTH